MLRILTWNSNTGFEKMQSQDLPSLGQSPPSIPIPCADAVVKRKRSFDTSMSPVVADSRAVKPAVVTANDVAALRSIEDDANALDMATASSLATSSSPNAVAPCNNASKMATEPATLSPAQVKSKEEAQLATMRQTISTQLNLEILLKHRELRLIDQELAKCQIALEQLRRCTEIPYPAMSKASEQVSLGKGAAVRKANDKHPARSPAPWGVADGPYTRHYARWLLPDPTFDGGEIEAPRHVSYAAAHGHSTRGHYTDFAQMVGKTSRSQRALNAGLPAGYAEPKQKPTGPMILKRKSDGKMVKLVCPDCDRFDFGSAQGFINHCRIGHQRNYASHDAAAEGCGQPIELDENGVIKGMQAESTAPSTPVVAVPPLMTPATTPIATQVIPPTFSLTTVHPLVKTVNQTSKDAMKKPLVKGGYLPKARRKERKIKTSSNVSSSCPAAPNLAAFIEKQGLSLNLQEAVTEAKLKLEVEDDYGDYCMDVDSPIPTPHGTTRHIQVAGKKQPMKSLSHVGKSRKPSFTQPHSRSREDNLGSFSTASSAGESVTYGGFMPLLPSPTNESTQAPSLIDDDEEMDPQSPPSSDEIDEGDIHFHVRDDEQMEEGHDLRSQEMPAPGTCAQPDQPSQTLQPSLPSQTGLARPLSSKTDKPINFVAEKARPKEEHDRKRRKIGS